MVAPEGAPSLVPSLDCSVVARRASRVTRTLPWWAQCWPSLGYHEYVGVFENGNCYSELSPVDGFSVDLNR